MDAKSHLADLVPLGQTDLDAPNFHDEWLKPLNKEGSTGTLRHKGQKPLGTGSFSIVYQVERPESELHAKGSKHKNKVFAAKVITRMHGPKETWPRDVFTERRIEWFAKHEAKVLSKLRHENVMKCYGAFENKRAWVLVLQFAAGGNIDDRMVNSGRYVLTEEEAIHYTRQEVAGLAYVHSEDLIHRDIKPGNFFIKNAYDKSTPFTSDHLLIGDFGFAVETEIRLEDRTTCGSLIYMAPEVYCKSDFSKAGDMWGIGIITLEILAAVQLPRYLLELNGIKKISGSYLDNLMKNLNNEMVQNTLESPRFSEIPPAAKQFIRSCLNVDPNERISATNALHDPWLSSITTDSKSTSHGKSTASISQRGVGMGEHRASERKHSQESLTIRSKYKDNTGLKKK